MLSRSCFNLLDLNDYSCGDRALIPKVLMTVPGILSEFEGGVNPEMSDQSDVVSYVRRERRIIVANQLPLRCFIDEVTKKWGFDWDEDALVLQLKDGFVSDVEVIFVGSLAVEIDSCDQEEVAQLLPDKFRCVPTFIPIDIHNKFYHGFCKHYLWPLFHYKLPVTANLGVRFNRTMWKAYVSANKIFADKVMEVVNPDEDYVWVQDYHLLLLPTFLRKRFHRVSPVIDMVMVNCYFTRWNKDSQWECSMSAVDFEWKKIALPVIEHYTEATDGSSIEQKESALVWHHQEADPDFGSWQAKELHDHLENVLANEPVVVKRGQHIVEVKPQGVSKGVAVDSLIVTMQRKGKLPDFVLCIGDDSSDEDMFESIACYVANPSLPAIAEVFACTVGRKPSMAKYYLDDTVDVIKMLEGLSDASPVQNPKSLHYPVV